MPADLKQRLDANEAMLKAQQSLVQNQTAEADRINARYDEEARRLAPLWKGTSISTQSMPGRPALSRRPRGRVPSTEPAFNS